MNKPLITDEVARKTMASLTTILVEGDKITTASNRGEILDYVLKNHAAVWVDQEKPLNLCGTGRDDLKLTMGSPLLLDMQTANAIKTVRDNLMEANRIKYDGMSWARAALFAWQQFSK